jgi:tRNA (guanine37-N1)-methyltransferase
MSNKTPISRYAIKISKRKGNERVKQLKESGLFDLSREIETDGRFLWIPVKKKIAGAQRKKLTRKNRPKSLNEKFGITSFDIIGDIIVIFIPDRLVEQKEEIGVQLMKLYPSVKAVYRETGKPKDHLRIQAKELIAGEGKKTIHKENNLQFRLDILEVYFSSRQITERMNLVNYYQKVKDVCVFFSGIGIIPIYFSKFTTAKEIIGIELNKTAHKYALGNLQLNNIQNVKLINGDVEKIVPELAMEREFDLVIIPLPKNTSGFLEIASKIVKPSGHLAISYVGTKSQALKFRYKLIKAGFTITQEKEERSVAPRQYRYTFYTRKNR